MGDHIQRIKDFEREMNADFIADFTRRFESLYRTTYNECQDYMKPYQRYMRPHILRANVEMALLSVARRHNLQAYTSCNSSRDAHALVMDGRYVITVSRAKDPKSPPRPAKFRSTYAAYCDLGQLRLPGPDFSEGQQKVIAISDRSHPVYILITHGPKQDDWREVGFAYANIVVPFGRGFRYYGSGIDLFARFASQDQLAIEDVPEPMVQIRTNDLMDKYAGMDG